MKLSDFVSINSAFVEKFKQGEYRTFSNELDLKNEFGGIVNSLNDDELLNHFVNADEETDKNLSNTFSYVTPLALGISIEVPHVYGDHVEIELKYEDLADSLKKEMFYEE
ncbi:hypothetical protein D3C78_1305600 [compost metagenome]